MADTLIDAATPRQAWPDAQAPELSWRESATGYLFLAPWLIGFFGLTLGPALVSLYLSFTDYDLLSNPRWVGTANYLRIATSKVCATSSPLDLLPHPVPPVATPAPPQYF